jgi:hypothetical protein
MRRVVALLATASLISAGSLCWRAGAEAAPTLPRHSHIAFLPFSDILDFSFVDSRRGWALGASCSRSGTCDSVAVRATNDGGRTWLAVGAPQAYPNWVSSNPRDLHGADSIRFADLRIGWIYGAGLWSTHEGGLTWQKDGQAAAVRALAVAGGSAWAVEGWCPGDSARLCHYVLTETSGAPDRWRTVVPIPGVQGRVVVLTRAGNSIGWLL